MLAWELEFGDMVPDFYRTWRARGEPPVALAMRPTLRRELHYVFDAFWALCSDRGGDGTGGILFSAMDRYARWIGITGRDEFLTFCDLLRRMDRVWLHECAMRRSEHDAADRARAKLEAQAPSANSGR